MSQAEIRIEAKCFSWTDLLDDQRSACKRIQDLILAIEEKAPPIDEKTETSSGLHAVLPRVLATRPNGVVLIDGARGSGKTSVMLSLLNAWSELARHRQWPLDTPDPKHPEDSQEWKPPRILPKGLHDPMPVRILPLPILDLRPLPESAQLIMQVAGSLLRLVEAIETEHGTGERDGREAAPWALEAADLPSRKAWSSFVDAAARGWDSNLRERRSHLDPESFAAELEDAERLRMDVVPRWKPLVDRVLRDLVDVRGPFPKERTILVIPIDDADMNPARSVELLELVRVLWHPRVAFLLTGDSDLFLMILRQHFLGALRQPLRGLPVSVEEHAAIGDVDMAVDLAQAFFDKVIPASHRTQLPPVPLPERRRLLQSALEDVQTPKTVVGSKDVTNLYEVLENGFQLGPLLPDRVRTLMDMAAVVRSLGPTLTGRDAVQLLRVSLSRSTLLRRHAGEILDSIDIEGGRLRTYEAPWRIVSRVPIAREVPVGSATAYLRGPERYAGVFSGVAGSSSPTPARQSSDSPPKERDLALPLDGATTSALILVKLFAEQDDSSFERHDEFFFVKHRPPDKSELSIHWPVPEAPHFVGDVLFALVWHQAIGSLGTSPSQEDIDRLAFTYLWLAAEARDLRGGWKDGLGLERPTMPHQKGPSSLPWKELAEKLLGPVGTSSPSLTWARESAPLLFFPESGVSIAYGKYFFSAARNHFGPKWKAARARIVSERLQRFRECAPSDYGTPDRAAEAALELFEDPSFTTGDPSGSRPRPPRKSAR
jgi:hypothetical protein